MTGRSRLLFSLLLAAGALVACTTNAIDSTFEESSLVPGTIDPGAPPPPGSVVVSHPDDAAAPADAAPIAPAAAYTCDEPAKQCALTCVPGACTLACDPADETDCSWSCAPPDCSCADTPTAACALHDPIAVCNTKCEKPECEIQCPTCTEEPCGACTTACKQPHCVTHCEAPKYPADSGAQRVTRCQAPRPSGKATCSPTTCTWAEGANGLQPTCAPPVCRTVYDEAPAAACTITGCTEQCDPLGTCTQQCDKPACTRDPDTGIVTCDAAPTGCTETCTGGACHVTTCD